jgi:hypothetical protein
MKFFSWFATFFDDNTGGESTTRALAWIWMLFLVGNLTFITIHNKALPTIETSYVTVTGIVLAAKVGQRIIEK